MSTYKFICLISSVLINYVVYSQSCDSIIDRFDFVYSNVCAQEQYSLFLSKENKFLFVDYGGSRLDMIFPSSFSYGNFQRRNDSLFFEFSKDSVFFKDGIKPWKEVSFCSYRSLHDRFDENGFTYRSCVIKNDWLTINEFSFSPYKQKSTIHLSKYQQEQFSFSLIGKLPERFEKCLRSAYFSLDSLKRDVQMSLFSELDTISSLESINLGEMRTLDTFMSTLRVTPKHKIVLRINSKSVSFLPIERNYYDLKRDDVNRFVLQVTDKHNSKWDFLNPKANECWIIHSVPYVEPHIVIRDIWGNIIDIEKEKAKLIRKILHETASETYEDALKILLKSEFFRKNKENITFTVESNLPDNAYAIFKLFNHFSINCIGEIYENFYNHTNDLDYYSIHSEKKGIHKFQLSRPGFNSSKTVCFLNCKLDDSIEQILVFERRLKHFVMTGKIIRGMYNPIPMDKNEYFPDFRNWHLFINKQNKNSAAN